jgi:hypothetical protein
MLVVTANWNITDGTLWRRPLRGLVARAWGAIQRAALRAGFQRDGRYEPIDRLDIVFAGDTCDLLSSRCWIERDLSPWNRSTRVAALRRQIARAALRRAAPLLRRTRDLLAERLAVPAATAQGRPHPQRQISVPVTVTLLAGDRDGFLEAAVPNWQQVHWAERWQGSGWQIEHGERFDVLAQQHHDESGRRPSFSQSVTIGLVARFVNAVNADSGKAAALPSRSLRLLADSHPLGLPDLFWRCLLPHVADRSQQQAKRLTTAWKKAVNGWHREAVWNQIEVASQFDFVGRFAEALTTPGKSNRASQLLAELCGTTAAHQKEATLPALQGLLLGHPNEIIQAASWGAAAAGHCLGQPLVVKDTGGLVQGETVDVKLVEPVQRTLRPASPRGLAVIGDATDGRVESIDFSTHSPAVAWQPVAPAAEWLRPRQQTGEAA